MWRPILLPALAVAFAVAGCAGTTTATPNPPPSLGPSTPTPNPNLVECSNVERAYNAWKWTPTSSLDWTDFNVRRLMESGDDFYKAVKGYQDPPALALVTAIAQYNFDLALLNAEYAARGSADSSFTTRITDQIGVINGKFASFKYETCR